LAENFSAETFDVIVGTVREILDTVAPKRARFSLEMMQTCPPDSVDSYLDLIRAIDDDRFGVHLDPANIFYSPRQCYDSGATIRDCVERLGEWIVSCHAKDLTIRPGLAVHIDECIPGTGVLDYPAYVAALRTLGRDVPLMLEHLKSEAEYRQARDHVRGVIDAAGAN
jgi:sugar phosphate isomerase/epimerase